MSYQKLSLVADVHLGDRNQLKHLAKVTEILETAQAEIHKLEIHTELTSVPFRPKRPISHHPLKSDEKAAETTPPAEQSTEGQISPTFVPAPESTIERMERTAKNRNA